MVKQELLEYCTTLQSLKEAIVKCNLNNTLVLTC